MQREADTRHEPVGAPEHEEEVDGCQAIPLKGEGRSSNHRGRLPWPR